MNAQPMRESNDRPRRANGKVYLAHCGMQARTRRLRQRARPALRAKDEASKAVVAAAFDATAAEPYPEYGALHLVCMALEVEDGAGVPWQQGLVVFLEKFERRRGETPDNFLQRTSAEAALRAPKAYAAKAVTGADVTIDETVPKGQVHFRDGAGHLLSVLKLEVPPLAPSTSRIKALWDAARESWA